MEPIQVEVTLDLDKHIHATYRQVSEDDYEPVPATLESLVLDEAARQLLRQLTAGERWNDETTAKNELRGRVREITDGEIRARIVPLIDEALAASIRQTNTFGEPTGPATTLRDLILEEVKAAVKEITAPAGRDGYGSRKPSVLADLVAQEVGAAFTKEVKAELDKAKAEVLEAVRAKGAEVLAATVRDMAGKL